MCMCTFRLQQISIKAQCKIPFLLSATAYVKAYKSGCSYLAKQIYLSFFFFWYLHAEIRHTFSSIVCIKSREHHESPLLWMRASPFLLPAMHPYTDWAL